MQRMRTEMIGESDVVTASLARGLRRRMDAGLQERIDRLADDPTLSQDGRFSVIVRRLDQSLTRTFGVARVFRGTNTKRASMWALAFPESELRDRLIMFFVRRRNSGVERQWLPTRVCSTAHCRERLIQVDRGAEFPIVALHYAVAMWSLREDMSQAASTVFLATPFSLLIGELDQDGDIEMRTVIGADALGPGKRAIWEKIRNKWPPIEFRPGRAASVESDTGED